MLIKCEECEGGTREGDVYVGDVLMAVERQCIFCDGIGWVEDDVPNIMRKFISKPVYAIQLLESAFTCEHPSEEHIRGVIYNPINKTASGDSWVATIGDWIVRDHNGRTTVVGNSQFLEQYEVVK